MLGGFHFIRQAQLPPGESPLTSQARCAVEVDEIFFKNINDLSKDLRIVSGGGKELPFVLKKLTQSATMRREVQLSGKLIRNQQLPDKRNVVDFELAADSAMVSAVELIGKELPAGALLTISVGSGSNFTVAVDKFELSDNTLLPEVVNRRFPLPRMLHGKIVRLTLEKGEFTNLEAVRVYTQTEDLQVNSAASRSFDLHEIERKVSDRDIRILFSAGNLPLTQLKINSSNARYLRKVNLLSSNDRRKWEPVTSGTIRKFDLDVVNTLDFPEIRCKYLLLQIENANGKMLENLQISAAGSIYQWWVNADEELRKITIYYGAESAVAPVNYQLEEHPQPTTVFVLQPSQPNPVRKTGVRDRGSWQHLAGALIVAMAFLAVAAALINTEKSTGILPED